MGDLNSRHNRAVWFDLYVDDLERASDFYAAVLAITVHRETFGEMRFSVLDHGEGNGGCLLPRQPDTRRGNSLLLYLNVNGRIRDAVARTRTNGGRVLQDVHSIAPHGFRAVIQDTEDNVIALHSETDA